MLKQRVITAVVLAAIFLTTLFALPLVWFILLVAVFIVQGAREWSNLAGLKGTSVIAFMVLMGLGMVLSFAAAGGLSDLPGLEWLRGILLAGCLWWAIALLWVQGYPSSALLWGRKPVEILMGYFVLIPAWTAITWLVSLPSGQWLVILVILTVVCADVGAYFAGRAFGRRKLAPDVSPGKTLEGFLGGLLLVLVAASAVIALSPSQQGLWLQWTIILLATALSSVLGDLLESMVKRHRGVKDSGTILPGHGGVLDRIDSMTAALPVFGLLYLLLIFSPA